jgi:hypothetical protein
MNRRLPGSFYRIHQTQAMATGSGTGPGAVVCQETSANRQMGCLTAANPCSIGFAGRHAMDMPGAVPLRLRGVAPDAASLRTMSYPFSRKMYLTSVVAQDVAGSGWGQPGTAAQRAAQQALWNCFSNPAQANVACEAVGYIAASATDGLPPFGPRCEDLDEATVCPGWPHPPRDACLPLAEHCKNGVQDADETGIDRGGADCPVAGGGVPPSGGVAVAGSNDAIGSLQDLGQVEECILRPIP